MRARRIFLLLFYTASLALQNTSLSGQDTSQLSPPYPRSEVIQSITWAPKSQIIRLARGSDNWPTAWVDDRSFFTAYGDGNGFEPFLPRKLSLGLAQVVGVPPNIKGVNIPTEPEFLGDGPRGYKASAL